MLSVDSPTDPAVELKCPYCESQAVYAPGPYRQEPIFDHWVGWLICHHCGKVSEIYYESNDG